MLVIFNHEIQTQDNEFNALDMALRGASRKKIASRYKNFAKPVIGKIFAAKSIVEKIETELKTIGESTMLFGENSIINKYINNVTGKGPGEISGIRILYVENEPAKIEIMPVTSTLTDNTITINSTDDKKIHYRKTKITEDIVKGILDRSKSYAELKERFGISTTTIIRVRQGIYKGKFPNAYNSDPQSKPVDTTQVPVKDVLTKIVPSCYWTRCALVAGRHNMPVQKAIFKHSLSKEQMFNEIELERIVTDFINIELEKDSSGILCYTTGIQCALGALIKVCSQRRVNLILMNYDTDTSTYHSQIIWKEFPNYQEPDIDIHQSQMYSNVLRTYDVANLYNCKVEELHNIIFIVSKVIFDNEHDMSSSTYRVAYICKSETDAWQLYSELIPDLARTTDNTGIFLQEVTIKSNGNFDSRRISKSQNF